jgi:hypothetical protein
MAQKFVLTAALNIQAPNMNKVVRNINQQLQGVSVNLNVPNAAKTSKNIQKINKDLKKTSSDADKASMSMKKLGASIGSTIGQFIKYDIARAAINLFSRAISDGLSDAIRFEREMVKIAQVTGAAAGELKDLERAISKVATGMGVASMSLLEASRVLAQTGMEAGKVRIALKALAKTTLAPTFDSITDTTETAVAAMSQFRLEAEQLEGVLSSINAVAGKFAVESSDIGVAIRRAGGAFKSAGGQINELIALFTSVRSTTRETAETIATGFRTIFTRMQRPGTIKFLEQFGVKLQDLNGKFVGPYEAVRRLHLVLKNLDPRDVRYSQIIEQLGGFRQVSKVIPLIQEFKVSQEALNVAIAGTGSLSVDASKAQNTFAVKITKLKEEVKELFRVITESTAFRVMLDGAIAMAKALTNITTTLGPLIPMLTAVFAIRGIGALGGVLGGVRKGISTQGGNAMMGFARGGIVPGTGTGDTVPARLSPGEFVIRKSAVEAFGAGNLSKINKYAVGGPVQADKIRGFSTVSDRIVTDVNAKHLRKTGGAALTKDHYYNPQDTFTIDDYQNNPISYKQKRSTDSSGKKVVSHYEVTSQSGMKTHTKPSPQFDAIHSHYNKKSGASWETMLTTLGFMGGDKSLFGGKKPFDGRGPGGYYVEARSRTKKSPIGTVIDKAVRQSELEALPIQNRLTAGTNHIHFPFNVRKYEDARKLAKGGKLTSQGTDSIPALLTPGEFVINKKSAQSFGYNKLSGINKYAKGGVVGGGKRAKMFMGGDPMSSLMMMFGMGGMGGGGGGGGQKGAADALNNLTTSATKASQGLKASLGGVTSGLGQVASSSLMTYSKIQFMGGAVDALVTSIGIENEAVHSVIGGLTNVTSWLFTAGTALSTFVNSGLASSIGGLFSSLKGNALVQMVGAPIKSMLSGIAEMAIGQTAATGGIAGAKGLKSRIGAKIAGAQGVIGEIKGDFARNAAQQPAYAGAKAAGFSDDAILARQAMLQKELAVAQGRVKAFSAGYAKHQKVVMDATSKINKMKGVYIQAAQGHQIATANVNKFGRLISKAQTVIPKMQVAQNALVADYNATRVLNQNARSATKGLTTAFDEASSGVEQLKKVKGSRVEKWFQLQKQRSAFQQSVQAGTARNTMAIRGQTGIIGPGNTGAKIGKETGGVMLKSFDDQIAATERSIAKVTKNLQTMSDKVIQTKDALTGNIKTIIRNDEALKVLRTNAMQGGAELRATIGEANKLPQQLRAAVMQQSQMASTISTEGALAQNLRGAQGALQHSQGALQTADNIGLRGTLADDVTRAGTKLGVADDAAAVASRAGKGFKLGTAVKGVAKAMTSLTAVLAMGALAAEYFLGKQNDAMGEEIKQAQKAGASWEDVRGKVMKRAAVATGQGMAAAHGTVEGGRFAGKMAGRATLKVGQKVGSRALKKIGVTVARGIGKHLIASATRAAVTTGSTAGTAALIEIPLLLAELGYAIANGADQINNAAADYKSAEFADAQNELTVAFGAFKDGTLGAAAMANKLGNTHKLNAIRSKDIEADKATGAIGVRGVMSAGSFTLDAMKEGDWLTAAGGAIATTFQTAFLPLTSTLDMFGVQGWWGRDNDLIAADEASLSRARVEQSDMAPEIMAGAMETAFQAMRKGDGSTATGMSAFEGALGGAENLEIIAGLLGMEADVLRQKFREQADETGAIIKANKEFEEAQRAMARSTRAAMDIMLGIISMAPKIAGLEAQIANTMASFAGGSSAANIVNKAPQFSNEALSAISTPEQWDELSANVESVSGYLGNAGALIQKEFLGGAQVMSLLPDALETLKNDMTNLTGDTSDAGDRVIDEIKNRIEASGGDWDKIPQTIKDRIRSKINSLDINAENFDENMAAILEDAGAAFTPYQQAIQSGAEAVYKYNKMYGAALAQRNQMEMSFIQGQMKILQLQQAGEDMIRQATGGKLTAADSAATFKAQQQTLLGGGSGLAGNMVLSGAGGAASNLGVDELGSLYVEQKKKMAALNKQISAVTATKGDEAEEVKALQDEYGELQKQTQQTKQALEAYTDVQKRAAGIQAELSREQASRQTKRGVLSDFAFADDAGRASQIKGMQSAFTAIQAGDLGAVSEDQRGAVGAFLDKFSDISLAAFGGKTGGDIKKELEIKELEKVMGRDLSGDEKKQIMESTSKEDQLINDLRALNEEAVTAQEALNNGIKVSIEEMNTNLADLNRKFLNELKEIFVARQKARLQGEKLKDEKGLKDTADDLAQATAALEMAGLGNLQGDDRDDALKMLTANKDLIANAAAAQATSSDMMEGMKVMQGFGGSNLGAMEDQMQTRMGVGFFGGNEHGNVSIAKAREAVFAQTQMMAGKLSAGGRDAEGNMVGGEARQAAMSASVEISKVFDKLGMGQTLAKATEGNAAALDAFRAAGYTGKEEEIMSMDANHSAAIIDSYMSNAMSSGYNQAENTIDTLRTALEANPLFNEETINKIMGNSEGLTERLKSLLPDTTFSELNDQLVKQKDHLKLVNEQLDTIAGTGGSEYQSDEVQPLKPQNHARGGPIYASTGMFIPRGTDTVPAMLTPGEFVIRRNAVKAVGMPMLQRINSMGKGGRQQGGNGYYANGGNVGGGLALDFSGLDNSINKFSQQITRLGDALSGGFSINVGGEININVRLNGAEMLEGAKDALGQVAADKVEKGITRMLKRHFPKLNNKSGLHRIKES